MPPSQKQWPQSYPKGESSKHIQKKPGAPTIQASQSMTHTLSKTPVNPQPEKNTHPLHENAKATQDITRHPNRTALTKMHMLHVYNLEPAPPENATETKQQSRRDQNMIMQLIEPCPLSPVQVRASPSNPSFQR